ncbi:MAG: hypothetical protein V2I33_21920 [Kangiellaceae bacterium]|jgi:O-phospho-L-seryl-tRNASec:L-selenocysteinyl-tRNA synthase|nr:hypothetical protein [Kangiellaceae bacterium]
MDSNNYAGKAGVGEREGRVIAPMVARRHYYMSHGVGRSGELTALQPKAIGSSILASLTNSLAKHALSLCQLHAKQAIVVPLATGMCLTVVLLALRARRPAATKVILPRID